MGPKAHIITDMNSSIGVTTSPLPLGTLEYQTAYQASSNSKTTNDSDTNKPLFSNLVINKRLQTLRLQIVLLQVEEQFVVAAGFCVVA